MLPNLVWQPLVQFEVFPAWGQTGQVNDEGKRCEVEQHGECFEILGHVEDARQARGLVMVLPHVPLGHGVHDEGTDGGGLALTGPGQRQDDTGVGVVVEKDGDEAG